MKKYILLTITTLFFVCGIVTANAQVPAEVSAVLKKSSVAMSDPTGVEYEMDIKVKMLMVNVLSGKMTMASLGEKNRFTMTVKAMGQEMITEGGFDGEYDSFHFRIDVHDFGVCGYCKLPFVVKKTHRNTGAFSKGTIMKKHLSVFCQKLSASLGNNIEYYGQEKYGTLNHFLPVLVYTHK